MNKQQIKEHIINQAIPFMICKKSYKLIYIDYNHQVDDLVNYITNLIPTHWVGAERIKGE